MLFEPFTVCGLTLRNRIVMAPMTRKGSPNGVPGPDVAAYYRRRAENDVGLIVTEGAAIDHPAAVDHSSVPHLYGEAALRGWAAVVDDVHAVGGKIVAQLWHVGSLRRNAAGQGDVAAIGPSEIWRRGTRVCMAMSERDIDAVITAYATAATAAVQCGFDGIEVHAAHGYLIDQFLWGATNRRQDGYGGDVAERARFAVEVVAACRAAVGPGVPILLRFSQWKLQDYAATLAASAPALAGLLAPLVDAGVDVFHCSSRFFWQPAFEGSERTLAAWTKHLTGCPVITVGAVGQRGDFLTSAADGTDLLHGTVARLQQMIEAGDVDLVAVGRALLADPEWVVKVRGNRTSDIRPYVAEALATLA